MSPRLVSRLGEILVGGFAVPLDGLDVVARQPVLALSVFDAEQILRRRIAAIGRGHGVGERSGEGGRVGPRFGGVTTIRRRLQRGTAARRSPSERRQSEVARRRRTIETAPTPTSATSERGRRHRPPRAIPATGRECSAALSTTERRGGAIRIGSAGVSISRVSLCSIFGASSRIAEAPSASLKARVEAKRWSAFSTAHAMMAASTSNRGRVRARSGGRASD